MVGSGIPAHMLYSRVITWAGGAVSGSSSLVRDEFDDDASDMVRFGYNKQVGRGTSLVVCSVIHSLVISACGDGIGFDGDLKCRLASVAYRCKSHGGEVHSARVFRQPALAA